MSVRSILATLLLAALPVAAFSADEVPERQTLPLPEAVAQMRATYLEQLGALQAEFAETKNPARAAELQTQIRLVKLGFEADFLSYQLDRAEALGKTEGQQELRASLEAVRALMRAEEPEAPQIEQQEEDK
jgi:hypothetical protein